MNYSKKSYVFTIEDFFLGRLYPLILCLLVLVAQIFSLEHIIIPLFLVIVCISLIVCKSIKPFIAPLCSFVYMLSLKNAVFGPNSSDYYFTGWRLIAIFLLAALVIASFVIFLYRTSFIRKLKEIKTPGIIPLLLLCGAFLLGGIGSEHWHPNNLLIALTQIVAYLVVYVLFFHGFSEDDDAEDLSEYFAYICTLITLVLAAELIAVYITNNVVVDGVINRENIKFGWGICNTLGINANILIPLNFYAAYRSKRHSWAYFGAAVIAYLTSVFSISRNGLLIGGIIFVLCLLLFCFFGDKKRFFRICTLILAIATLAVFAIFHNEILTAFKSYVDRGFDDSNRFEIWKRAWTHFLEKPIFGNGFKAPLLFSEGTESFMPLMAHNTIFEILFAMGGVGIVCYGVYRLSTIIPFIKKPSIMKCSMALLVLTLLASSLLDNFAFHIQPVFFYSIAMAIVQRAANEKDYFI